MVPADGAKPRQVLVSSADEVFGAAAEQAPVAAATPAVESNDVYDDMPDDA